LIKKEKGPGLAPFFYLNIKEPENKEERVKKE
jgi:hypothetical protein